MTYGTIIPSQQDKRKGIRGIFVFDNKRRIYLNKNERIEFERWLSERIETTIEVMGVKNGR